MPVLVGLDPGINHFGWAKFFFGTDLEEDRLAEMGVICAPMSTRKGEVSRASDMHERGRKLALGLDRVLQEADAVACEAISLPPGSRAAAVIGRAYGVVDALTARLDLPVTQMSPQDWKRAILGDIGGQIRGKMFTMEAIRNRWPGEAIRAFEAGCPDKQWHHGYDAAGVATACMESNLVRAMRRAC